MLDLRDCTPTRITIKKIACKGKDQRIRGTPPKELLIKAVRSEQDIVIMRKAIRRDGGFEVVRVEDSSIRS